MDHHCPWTIDNNEHQERWKESIICLQSEKINTKTRELASRECHTVASTFGECVHIYVYFPA